MTAEKAGSDIESGAVHPAPGLQFVRDGLSLTAFAAHSKPGSLDAPPLAPATDYLSRLETYLPPQFDFERWSAAPWERMGPGSRAPLKQAFAQLNEAEIIVLQRAARSNDERVNGIFAMLQTLCEAGRSNSYVKDRIAQWLVNLRLLLQGVDIKDIADFRGVTRPAININLKRFAEKVNEGTEIRELFDQLGFEAGVVVSTVPSDVPPPRAVTVKPLPNTKPHPPAYRPPVNALWNQDPLKEREKRAAALTNNYATFFDMDNTQQAAWRGFIDTSRTVEVTSQPQIAVATKVRATIIELLENVNHSKLKFGRQKKP